MNPDDKYRLTTDQIARDFDDLMTDIERLEDHAEEIRYLLCRYRDRFVQDGETGIYEAEEEDLCGEIYELTARAGSIEYLIRRLTIHQLALEPSDTLQPASPKDDEMPY